MSSLSSFPPPAPRRTLDVACLERDHLTNDLQLHSVTCNEHAAGLLELNKARWRGGGGKDGADGCAKGRSNKVRGPYGRSKGGADWSGKGKSGKGWEGSRNRKDGKGR